MLVVQVPTLFLYLQIYKYMNGFELLTANIRIQFTRWSLKFLLKGKLINLLVKLILQKYLFFVDLLGVWSSMIPWMLMFGSNLSCYPVSEIETFTIIATSGRKLHAIH